MGAISYDVTGSGPAVLLVHAGVADRRMWEPQLSTLSRHHQVVRVDLHGFGDSPLPEEPYAHVDDIVAVMNMTGIDTAAVVGASFGGLVSEQLAVLHPHRVERLLLLCPASAFLEPDQELKTFWAREEQLLDQGDLGAATALNVETWCGPEASPTVRELVATMQHHALELQIEREDLEVDDDPGDPAVIQAPTLVVSGGHDLKAFGAAAKALAQRLPRGELLALAWAGHLPNLERPDEVGSLMVDFLTR